jgi:hypothetical protein
MNRIFQLTILFCSITLCSQNLTKSEFDELNYQVDLELEHIENHHLEKLKISLNLENSKNFEKLKNVLSQGDIKFNKPNSRTFVSPHYKLTGIENQIELTISGMKILEKINDEKYQRASYYFIIKTIVELDKVSNKIKFYDAKIIINEKEIETWWLSQYKGYMENCRDLTNLYTYVCAPPPPPPKNLK